MSRPSKSPMPPNQAQGKPSGGQKFQVNTSTRVFNNHKGRILCLADIRGKMSSLNALAKEHGADAIIHTGDFGFFEADSLSRVSDRTLRHLAQYSPLLPPNQRSSLLDNSAPPAALREGLNVSLLSEFPLLVTGELTLDVPVYTIWGACEDVGVVEKIRQAQQDKVRGAPDPGKYLIKNLEVIDEACTRALDIGGIKLRLLGLGGALVPHKMFDNGEGNATIAGGQGTMWTSFLQMGELVDTSQRVFDPTETRVLVTHASPGREGIMSQLSLVTKADLTISAGLHFRYTTSHNDFSTSPDFETFRRKLEVGKDGFDKVWQSVKTQVEQVIDEHQSILLDKALSVVDRMPPSQNGAQGVGSAPIGEEPSWKNCWNWNLCDAAYGTLILEINQGRVSCEMKCQGFNYAYRRTATNQHTPASSVSAPIRTPKGPGASAAGGSGKGTPSVAPSTPAAAKENKDLAPNANVANASPSGQKEKDKGKKDKKKDKKDKAAEKASGTTTPGTTGDDNAKSPTSPADIKSPISTDGVKTPKNKAPVTRNPWTIFMKIRGQEGAGEEAVRGWYGDAASFITKVVYPHTFAGRNQKLCFVEFADEEGMRKGLAVAGKDLNGAVPEIKQADLDRAPGGGGGHQAKKSSEAGITSPPTNTTSTPVSEHPPQPHNQNQRGGGRGRGGRGGRGGFASRGLAAAGLTGGRGRGSGGPGGSAPNSAGAGGES